RMWSTYGSRSRPVPHFFRATVTVAPRGPHDLRFRLDMATEKVHSHTLPDLFNNVFRLVTGRVNQNLVMDHSHDVIQKACIFDVDKGLPEDVARGGLA